MNRLIIFFFIIITILNQNVGNALVLNALAFFFDKNTEYYSTIINKFNKYSIENKLDITIEINVVTSGGTSSSVNDYGEMIEVLLKKYDNKYDIYFYENTYLQKYSPYLLDLSNYLPKDYIDMYDQKTISELCRYDNKLIGIPISLLYTVFYSNTELLNKYNKRVPKTWNEMIDTSKFIINEERKKNNTELTAYNGLFNDCQQGSQSIYEFIFSCRDSVQEGYPEVGSKSFIDALEMMKRIKSEISSDSEFRSEEMYSLQKLFNGKSIFIKYWILNDPYISNIPYSISNIPGLIEGVSTTVETGFNIGIYKRIDVERIDAAIIALKYIGSKDIQTEYFRKRQLITAIKALYDDEDTCKDADCKLFKNMQPINDTTYLLKREESYSANYRNYIYEFLYGNKTAQEISQKIIDLTKIYQISINTSDSYIGLISIIVISTIAILMFFSLIALFKENFDPFFTFLSTDFWILSVIGTILILCIPFTNFGNITNTNCFTLILIPILYKLIVKYPTENIISKLIKKNIAWNGLLLIEPYSVEEVYADNGKNYEICKAKTTLNKVFVTLKWSYIAFIILLILLFIFIEWNIESTYYDLRFFISVVYIDIIGHILIICFNYIKIKNYILYYSISGCVYLIISISNYMLIYGFRLILAFIKKKNIRVELINKINKGFIENDDSEWKSKSRYVKSININIFKNYNLKFIVCLNDFI
ncbi:periplasmic binding protein-like II [Piromyces finnis]|uniref:Periplasmic binding protein-like II n=1 Tax=Piromyces finnis TaxID=1754191 RepID=A0A1Y1V9I7_9FUNG|nr:periplasmic binding protein-like II [Piromyces finnis]|eukprot:ORX50629.1 periplasmic binding protein-like II [Piromyces finnis]